ncbi:MAG TPA: L,D-transpeptidase [Anaerolineales bacterium]|nr:L,D-transpeptidase [Anaerolineales bacterium]
MSTLSTGPLPEKHRNNGRLSRRDFLKLGGLGLGTLAFSPSLQKFNSFDDSSLVRVANKSVSVYSRPTDKSSIVSTWYRDELLHTYGEVTVDEPAHNPVWYRVWGGYVHRSHLQRVKVLFNETLPSLNLEEGMRRLVEVTVPFTEPWRTSKTYGWQKLGFRLYYQSTHWVEAIETGPTGKPWYRVFDDLAGAYHIDPLHVRPIPFEELAPITPDVPPEKKRIEVNLTTQALLAYENDKEVLKTNISSGIPNGPRGADGLSTKTPQGEFHILEKDPAKHMGNGNLFADADDYELPGVPWTSFFTDKGHAFHGTYWHDNFGVPMSHGCINMRTEEAKWLFRWALPKHEIGKTTNRGYGTLVQVHY